MDWLVSLWNSLTWIVWPAGWRRAASEPINSAAAASAEQVEKVPAAAPATPAEARSGGCLWAVLRWGLHFLLLAGILVGLWYLNRHFGLERLLRSDWPALHPYWLPILFLLLYLLAWLGWWLWRMTGPDSVGWDYPDINTAWKEATGALAEAGIDVRKVPLFLVLGRPDGTESSLFEGADIALRVHQTPRGAEAPLHVYATAQAVFVTCAGASVLGQYLNLLARDRAFAPGRARLAGPTGRSRELGGTESAGPPGSRSLPGRSREPGGTTADLPDATGAALATETEERGPAPVPAEEQRVLGLLEAEERAEPGAQQTRSHRFLKDQAAVQLQTSRLQHLGRLIAHDRRPFCPINGVLVLVPLAVTADDQQASEAGTACRYDMTLLREVLQVQCPAFALVCDMETSAGYREVVRQLPAAQRVRRLGQRFPLLPDLEEAEIPGAVDRSLGWLCDALVPSLVYSLFRPGPEESLEGSSRLYRFLAEMRGRRRRLSRFLVRAFLLDLPLPALFGGVYFAATVQEAGPSFVGGVLDRLVEGQNYVSWLPGALDGDVRYRRWTWLGWAGIVVLVVGVPVAAYLLWRW